MARVRSLVGLLAGVVLLLSAYAHTFLGWEGLRSQLAGVSAPADLILGLQVGWYFGGVAMVVFGLVTVLIYVGRLRSRAVSRMPAAVTGAVYLAFGAWALFVSSFNPFFYLFLVTGLLLAVASWG